jgi:hypothetical protein
MSWFREHVSSYESSATVKRLQKRFSALSELCEFLFIHILRIVSDFNGYIKRWLKQETPKRSEFESRCGQEFSLLHIIQTESGAHPASYLMGTGGKAAEAWSWPLTSDWYRAQENVDLYIISPIRLHGVVLNSLCTGSTLPLTIPA